MKYLSFFLFFLPACNTPITILNAVTPDRLGVGTIDGTMDLTGKSSGWYDGNYDNGWGNHGWESGQTGADLKMEGSSNATMLWLEWDFPKWTDGALDADADRYMRERIRHLNYRIHMMEEEEKNNRVIDDWLDTKR